MCCYNMEVRQGFVFCVFFVNDIRQGRGVGRGRPVVFCWNWTPQEAVDTWLNRLQASSTKSGVVIVDHINPRTWR